jgi:YfiH family protein
VVAIFTTRHVGKGGLSYRSLGEGPDAEFEYDCVPHNRKAVFDALRPSAASIDLESFTGAKQAHGDNVCRVTEAERGRGARSHDDAVPATDALITDLPGVPIGVFTADCVPVFLYDPVRPAVGIAHAGWRGTAQSIAQKTIERMREEFASNPADMWAAIGPSIGPCCFEVGIDVHEKFWERFGYSAPLFRKTYEQKWHLDLWLANRLQLEECGLDAERIVESRICSACNSGDYHSARKHGPGAGRTLSVIGIKAS